MTTTSLRSEWFAWVAKTRAKMQRGKKERVLHRDAMRQASQSWPKQKQKIERANKRAAKKLQKQKIVKVETS